MQEITQICSIFVITFVVSYGICYTIYNVIVAKKINKINGMAKAAIDMIYDSVIEANKKMDTLNKDITDLKVEVGKLWIRTGLISVIAGIGGGVGGTALYIWKFFEYIPK